MVVVFGIRRIRRRRTPYVTAQTLTLMAIQVVPLFLLPEILLPWLNYHGCLPQGLADALFPAVSYGHGREFWRAYGLILAWPLNVYNVFTAHPLPAWLWICGIQTFVLIPAGDLLLRQGGLLRLDLLLRRPGRDPGRRLPAQDAPRPRWNRLNMLGQGMLLVAVLMLLLRIAGWIFPGGPAAARCSTWPWTGAAPTGRATSGRWTCSWPGSWATGSTSGSRAACGAGSPAPWPR